MVSIISTKTISNTIDSDMLDHRINLVVAAGLSTDDKPTSGIANGSMFIEMNSSKIYIYDEAGTTWREFK